MMQLRNSDKLRRAMRSLEETLVYTRSADFQGLGLEFKSILQAAVVQNFSLTFKVCMKMLEHQLADKYGKEHAAGTSEDTLIRAAAVENIISDVDSWLEYLECEHLTHAGTIPLRTFEKSSAFLKDAGELLGTCAFRINNERRAA
ncbi:MAG: nucleotidyltransferase substrate binding protein [Planctomycetaceae bacterium]|nr:nucleotidyltransferase substrate binding protein [Planctomycetaceae bacterium]